MDGLNRLSLSQRSFLRTGDLHFSQDVAESVIGIQKDVDSLHRIVTKRGRLRDKIIELSGAIEGGAGIASEIQRCRAISGYCRGARVAG